MKTVSKWCKACKVVVDLTPTNQCPRCGKVLTWARNRNVPLVVVKNGTPRFH